MAKTVAMKQADWAGRHVELLRDICTKAGGSFPAGEVMRVGSAYRGRLNLYDLGGIRHPNGGLRGIQKVAFEDVRLLDQ